MTLQSMVLRRVRVRIADMNTPSHRNAQMQISGRTATQGQYAAAVSCSGTLEVIARRYQGLTTSSTAAISRLQPRERAALRRTMSTSAVREPAPMARPPNTSAAVAKPSRRLATSIKACMRI